MSSEIQSIVEHLRAAPFNRSEGLVDFSKKSPLELLQVVTDVFALIDDRQKKDLRDETKDDMTARMLQFITVLGYRTAVDDPSVCTAAAASMRILQCYLLHQLQPAMHNIADVASL